MIISGLQKTTNPAVVLPFYLYASLGYLVGTLLLLAGTEVAAAHHFNPQVLAITHTMALAWGTMIIFGASHQLLPVLVEGKLDSDLLAHLTFAFAAVGIPVLIYGFYAFNVGLPMQAGAVLVNLAVLFYLVNVVRSSLKSNGRNVHAWFVITATVWLLATTLVGGVLVVNFSRNLLPGNSVEYLSLHAHLGIVGWFLLLVMGVGSRLIPMFLISKYTSNTTLWWIFGLLNGALISFSCIYLYGHPATLFYLPLAVGAAAVLLFGRYCYKAWRVRIRKRVDQQVATSLISVAQMVVPLVVLLAVLAFIPGEKLAFLYGFCIFFGWLTAIILGMTFKTMPFIVWNRVYHNKAHQGKTPAPKELFREGIYNWMLYCYLVGFVVFVAGTLTLNAWVLKAGALALVVSAALYVWNVVITLTHKAQRIDP